MKYKNVMVVSKEGLRSRAAASLVKKAMSFKSSISLSFDGRAANAKSMLNVLALKVPSKSEVTVVANGEDEELAIKEITDLTDILQQ